MSGPATGRRGRAGFLRASVACLALIGVAQAGLVRTAAAQALTRDLMNPVRDGFLSPQDSPLRKVNDPNTTGATPASNYGTADLMAPSRIGNTPTYGVPAANGASGMGYDSLNRTRKKPKLYPGAPKPKKLGPGNPPPVVPIAPLTVPMSSRASKAPLPAGVTGTADGQPLRRRLKLEDDPFAPLGVHVGSFLVKSAVELSGGYDTNPARFASPRGSSLYVIAPELLAASDWSRHSLVVDLRGSYTGYGSTFPAPPGQISGAPTNIDRPEFTGKVDGRVDVETDTRINSELRLHIGTDNPGSPNIQAGLSKYPLYATSGGSLGVEQDFNRLRLTATGNVDRTAYQNSELTDGESTTNVDRNFNQYGGVGRASYEVLPGLRPFAEVEGDSRVHDTRIDRNGFARDSNGGYAKAGTTFEFSRILTGEAAVGYALRSYADPRLPNLNGLLTSASLVWSATPLTTAKFSAGTSIDETTLPGVSGVLSHTYTIEVDHDFQRWLTAVGKFTYGTYDYQGTRFDKFYSAEGDLVYKLNREIQIKATVRRDILNSNEIGSSFTSTSAMLGIRLQR
jgi:hypothetical protein